MKIVSFLTALLFLSVMAFATPRPPLHHPHYGHYHGHRNVRHYHHTNYHRHFNHHYKHYHHGRPMHHAHHAQPHRAV